MFLAPCLLATFALAPLSSTAPLLSPSAARDAQEAKPRDVTVGGDPKKRYLLHAPGAKVKPPKDGWKLLVVMPGGAGSADFAPFVGNIREHALGDEWLCVQLVAPVWSEEQAKVLVWPTEKNSWPKMAFSCEELFDAALADVEKEHALDPKHLFTLGWSSSGTLTYTLALREKSRVTGSFVAMSVYKPDDLPSMKNAKGRAFYLLHSPEDWISIEHAKKALADLEKHGAKVEFREYFGNHGWNGDVFGTLRAGFEFLERAAASAKQKPGAKSGARTTKRTRG